MMTKGQFQKLLRKKFGFNGMRHTFPCGREAVFKPLCPMPREENEPLEAVQREPLLVFTRVGDSYVSGIDRFGTVPGSRLPHAYVSVEADGTVTLYAETRQKREVFVYELGE